MGMSDADRNTCGCRNGERDSAIEMDVAVDGRKRSFLPQNLRQCPLIYRQRRQAWAREDKNPPSQAPDFLIIMTRLIRVNRKIKLNLGSVNMPVNVHNERLSAATVHPSKNMEHPDDLAHILILPSGWMKRKFS
jgi:hypothetical protein